MEIFEGAPPPMGPAGSLRLTRLQVVEAPLQVHVPAAAQDVLPTDHGLQKAVNGTKKKNKKLWMDKILHHMEIMGNYCWWVFTGESACHGFLGGAGLSPSTVGVLGEKDGYPW